MLVSAIKEADLTPELVDRLLFQGLEDSGDSADCILVLGSIKGRKVPDPRCGGGLQGGPSEEDFALRRKAPGISRWKTRRGPGHVSGGFGDGSAQ